MIVVNENCTILDNPFERMILEIGGADPDQRIFDKAELAEALTAFVHRLAVEAPEVLDKLGREMEQTGALDPYKPRN